MLRAGRLLLLLALAACRGGSDSNSNAPACAEARPLYLERRVEAADRVIAANPSPAERNLLANRLRDEVRRVERAFAAACGAMDGGAILACARTAQAMDSADCQPLMRELERRMAP